MRIWHEDLIPKLCQKHLCAMWREALGCYKIVTGEVDGGSYKNHPATKEFKNHSEFLWTRLFAVREEMLKRGYHPKKMPDIDFVKIRLDNKFNKKPAYTPWQTLDQPSL